MSDHKSAALIYPMPPDAETLIADKGRPSCFVARSNIPSSARLLRGRSRSRRLESRVSLPEPDAYLSWTVTDARTAPDLPTDPLNFTRLGCVTTPSFMFTEKL